MEVGEGNALRLNKMEEESENLSDEEMEIDESIRFNPRFFRHKNSIFGPVIPRKRLKSPSLSSDDFIWEEEEDEDEELGCKIKSTVPIPDLLCGVPAISYDSEPSESLSQSLPSKPKVVRFKVPEKEVIPENYTRRDSEFKYYKHQAQIKLNSLMKRNKTKNSIKDAKFPCEGGKPEPADDASETYFQNSRILRWKLRFRRLWVQFALSAFCFCLFGVFLFLFPAIGRFITGSLPNGSSS